MISLPGGFYVSLSCCPSLRDPDKFEDLMLIPSILIDLFAFITNCSYRFYLSPYYKSISHHITGGLFSRDNIYRNMQAV